MGLALIGDGNDQVFGDYNDLLFGLIGTYIFPANGRPAKRANTALPTSS